MSLTRKLSAPLRQCHHRAGPRTRFPGLPVLLAAAGVASGACAEVRLNEFMAANDSTVVPGAVAGTFDDWIELYNDSAEAVDLGGWRLTDNAANPEKWTFPAGAVIPPGDYLIVFATTTGVPDANGNLHTNFALGAGGEYLGLVRPDGTIAGEFEAGGTSYPPQLEDVSYGRKPDDGSPVYFATPTPGAANAADGFLRVAAVTASTGRGFYSAPVQVSLVTPTPDATIYYTLNGSPPLQANGSPAASATTYSAPVSIATTTVLRAAAVKAGHDPAPVTSHTYIFPQEVAVQTRPAGYPASWGGEPSADYDVDPDVSQSSEDGARFLTGLRDLPTLSVAATVASLFGPSGIYSRPTNESLEAAVSAEYFQPGAEGDGANRLEGFQIDCGLVIQGGASRNPGSSIKHSFSLRFRTEYGAGKLEHDLFGPDAVTNFNNVHLRAMYNNSWIHSNVDQRGRATLIRDQWMRDSMIEMGQADALRGHYVHLYLNGLYWGVYNLHERPGSDHYAGYNGSGFDSGGIASYNPGGSTTAEQASFNSLRTVINGGDWDQIVQRLDVDSYIDYYIMQHFGRNEDLKTDGNWRATGGGAANAPWRFYLWDSERVLENRSTTGALAISQDGANLINALDHLPEFQVRFADRAWKHLTNGGALTNERNRARFLARVAELDNAIVGESARWGDDRPNGSGPFGDFTRTANWLPAIYGPLSMQPTGGVLGTNGWFPESGTTSRTSLMLAAWKSQTWPGTSVRKLPQTDPPTFTVNDEAQHGGLIPPGGVLRLTGGTGTLYVTTDGSDPRLEGGALKPGLVPYTTEAAIPLAASSLVKARWFSGSAWSALSEAFFFIEPPVGPGEVRITEINYHPADASASEQAAGAALAPARAFVDDDFQFLEVLNVSDHAVNLRGARFAEGVRFTFDNLRLDAGERAVVIKDPVAIAVRYGAETPFAGVWDGSLAHNGETVTLLGADGAIVTSVTYGDSGAWPSRPDSDGSTLEIISASGTPDDPGNWRSSVEFHGSPGVAGLGADGRVVVNEVLAHTTDTGLKDAIELANTTATPIDISGWFLSDSKSDYRAFRIPDGTVIPAEGYVVFDEDDFNATTPSYAIEGYVGTGSATPVTVTSPAHGLATGDVITISGYGGFGGYNGSFQVTALTADIFTIPAIFLDAHAALGEWVRGIPFGLSSSGEDVWLLETGADGELKRFVDHVEFPATPAPGQTFGRWPDAAGPLQIMHTRTLGAANSGPDPPPSGLLHWLAGHGLEESDLFLDIDHDGLDTIAEYALGLHPKTPDSHQLHEPQIDGTILRFRFPRAADRAEVIVTVEYSSDLETWEPSMSTVIGEEDGFQLHEAVFSLESGPALYVRCHFERAP